MRHALQALRSVSCAYFGAYCGVAAMAGCGSSGGPTTFDEQPGDAVDASVSGKQGTDGGIKSQGDGSGGVIVGMDAGVAETAPPCVGLECSLHPCSDGGSTSISGVVYDPAGKNPIYNAVVYVPNAAVQPLPSGASCDSCNALYTGDPLVATVTDAAGKFTLANAPDGADIPLVIQIGKWRKQITIPNVAQCQDNPQANGSLAFPKNHNEGDIPNIAISTGGADTLECLLARIGLDKAEYGGGSAGAGRIHIFQGSSSDPTAAPTTNPAAPQSSTGLWTSQTELMKYDMVLLSCEGEEAVGQNQQALHDYASAGGRVFASHFHYSWFNTGPYGSENLATWAPPGSNPIGGTNSTIKATVVTTLPNGQPFVKGLALQQWLTNVGALTNGELPIQAAKHNADVSATNTPSQAWIVADQQVPANDIGATEYLSFNTPTNAPLDDAGVPAYCGRVVFSDLHVGAASGDTPTMPVPDECKVVSLSPQEKALEFMLFDLSSCVTPDNKPPPPPPPPKIPPPK
jgi:hypothetical protein